MLTFNFKKYNFYQEGLMLDVGCGEGRHIFGIMQNYPMMKCIGLDMDEDSLKKAEEGYAYFKSISQAGTEFMKGSAYSLPFPDSTFDLIVCSEVLEHLHKYTDAIIEISLVQAYKKMLERHILKKPFISNSIDKLMNPIMGKSFSMYFEKI